MSVSTMADVSLDEPRDLADMNRIDGFAESKTNTCRFENIK